MKRPFRANYSEQELTALTDEWVDWEGNKSFQFILVRLMDLDNAMMHLSPPQREAIFLIGLCQLTLREAAELAGVTHQAMWKRYQRGLTSMASYLNGG